MVVTWAYNSGTNTATASGAGSTNFAALVAADTAGGWGKYTADATGTQIICQGKIVIGDGTNAAVFTDTNKQVMAIGFTAGDQTWLTIANHSSITLGELTDATDKTTRYGCVIYVYYNNAYAGIRITGHSGATVNLYSCMIIGAPNRVDISTIYGKVYNCQFVKCDISYFSGDWYNSIGSTNAFYLGFIRDIVAGSTIDKIEVYDDSAAAIACGYNSLIISNARIRNCAYSFYKYTQATADVGNLYAIDCDADAWTISWGGANAYGWVIRQYTFDLQVCDNVESEAQGTVVPIEGADVTLYDKDGHEVFNETSDATGWIPTQTVSRGYYAQATGNTMQDYGPHFLVVTKEGYEPYMDEYILTEKRVNQISMNLPGVPADLATATPTDVLTSKTFFGKAGSLETGTYEPPATVLTGNAEPSDVVAGKTFYKDNASVKLTGKLNFPVVSAPPKTRTKRVVNPIDEPLALTTAVLLAKELRRSRMAKFKVTS